MSGRPPGRTPLALRFVLSFALLYLALIVAMGWFLDGRVSAVIGTHTHIQTADDLILPGGTAYLTDVGMCGPWMSVIGIEWSLVLERFLTQMPVRFEVAQGPAVLSAVLVEVDPATGKATAIQRILERETDGSVGS